MSNTCSPQESHLIHSKLCDNSVYTVYCSQRCHPTKIESLEIAKFMFLTRSKK